MFFYKETRTTAQKRYHGRESEWVCLSNDAYICVPSSGVMPAARN